MHRRPLGMGRTLATVGGILILVGTFLRWFQIGRPGELTVLEGNGLAGAGIIVLLVGVATLLLVTLPYAVGDRPTAIDRWEAYALLAIVGWVGFGWHLIQLLGAGAFRFDEPLEVFTNGPGLWLAGVGLAVMSRAIYRMTREPVYR